MRGAGGREGPEEYGAVRSVACSPCPVTKVVSVLSGRQPQRSACIPLPTRVLRSALGHTTRNYLRHNKSTHEIASPERPRQGRVRHDLP